MWTILQLITNKNRNDPNKTLLHVYVTVLLCHQFNCTVLMPLCQEKTTKISSGHNIILQVYLFMSSKSLNDNCFTNHLLVTA